MPSRFSALITEQILPALYLMMAIFIAYPKKHSVVADISSAKLRISERKTKQKPKFLISFPNESKFGEANVTKKREKSQRNSYLI
ncbi:MAG: hypothetical protein IKX44_12555, partial [Prevotella sp.]|nr:hypothetical protein [Prevotella sp.]